MNFRWQYEESLMKNKDSMGRRGWELVSVLDSDEGPVGYFKRKIGEHIPGYDNS